MNDLAYTAGLIDGEGHVGWSGCGGGRKRFVIEVKMTSERVIDWLQSHYGGAKQFRPSKNPTWKHQWRWRISGKSALTLYEQLTPLLQVK